MKSSNVVSSIHHLKLAKEFLEDFCRQYKGSIGEKIFKNYIKKIDWFFSDIISTNAITEEVRQGIKDELACDILLVPELHRKIALLSPELRNGLEEVIDCILSGETIEIVSK